MKTKALIFILSFLFSLPEQLRAEERSVKPKLIASAKILGKANPVSSWPNNASWYYLELEVQNNTDSSIRFGIYNCSWAENWINSDCLHFYYNCDANFSITETLLKGQSITFYALLVNREPDLQLSSKFGFVFLENFEHFGKGLNVFDHWHDSYKKAISDNEVYWTNTVRISSPVVLTPFNELFRYRIE